MIPRPQFFLVRPDTEVLRNDTGAIQREQGPMVPLIAVDELPDWIDIGLPRELTVEQTVGLYNLGMVPHTGDTYRVRIIEPNSQEEFVWKRTRDSSKPTLVSSGVCAPGHRTMAQPEQSQRAPYNAPAASTGRNPSSIPRPSAAEPCPHPAPPNMAAASSNPNRLTRAEDEHSMRWADLVERSITRDTEAQDPRRHSTLLAPPPSPQIAPHHPTVHQDAMTPDHRASAPLHNTMTTPPNPAANTDALATANHNTPTIAANPASPGVTPSNSTSSSSAATTASSSTASSSPASSTPQEYCRHWCQHGTCKWGTFCRHKHAMPTTLEGLLEVGLCEIPAWWISATGIGISSKTKQTAAGGSPSTVNGNGGGGSGGGSGGAPPPPAPRNPMAHGHNLHHMLPAVMGAGAGLTAPASAKKLSNRKLKAQQREFNQRLRLLSSMLIPPGYGSSPHYPLRHPADALLMHGMHGYGSGSGSSSGSSGSGQQQLQQMQQQQQQRLERERKGEKTPLDRNRKNVKVTFNEDGTVSLVTGDEGGSKKGGVVVGGAGGHGQQPEGETTGGGGAASVPAAGASSAATATNTSETGKPGGGEGEATDKFSEDGKEKDMVKSVKGLANSMHAPKQGQGHGQVVVTIPGNMSMKATCEDENEGGSVVQLADVPLLVEI
ncbi:hypothetical protein QBC45DRAFT_28329 [Copromyces sp. CBS 386.78]|nr:hypothetical protein QBC45DRAFT_28329 [Copromyces sp. CBS 386.78]